MKILINNVQEASRAESLPNAAARCKPRAAFSASVKQYRFLNQTKLYLSHKTQTTKFISCIVKQSSSIHDSYQEKAKVIQVKLEKNVFLSVIRPLLADRQQLEERWEEKRREEETAEWGGRWNEITPEDWWVLMMHWTHNFG